jgi:hypothetical protein
MDTPVEFRCVDTSDREIVVYAMGIGEQRHGRMIRYVDRAVRERVALHDERETNANSIYSRSAYHHLVSCIEMFSFLLY